VAAVELQVEEEQEVVKRASGGDELKAARKRECVDTASSKACRKAVDNNLCQQGSLGGFGSTIRVMCQSTCGLC